MNISIAVTVASTLTLWYAQGSHLGAATRSDDLVAVRDIVGLSFARLRSFSSH